MMSGLGLALTFLGKKQHTLWLIIRNECISGKMQYNVKEFGM